MAALGNKREVIIQPSLLVADANEGAGAEFACTEAIWMVLVLVTTAVAGTTPNLVTKVQFFDVLSATWVDVPGGAFAAVTAAGTTLLMLGAPFAAVAGYTPFPPLIRMRLFHTVTGTATPSVTCSVSAHVMEMR